MSPHLITLLRQQVTLQPTTIAIQDDQHTLTYLELERWSNNLAHEIFSRLKDAGGFRAVAVGIPRSVLLVVSIIAIIKSGFSYIPLDPSAPHARLDDQVLQSDARLLLVVSGHPLPSLGRAIPFDIIPFIVRTCIKSPTELSSTELLSLSDTLVIFFTSGSTGRPKGVLLQHVSMANFINSRLMEIEPGDRVAMVNNPTFDVSSLDIWDTLCHGGTLFVFSGHLADTEAVLNFFRDNIINKAFLPTAVFHHLATNISNTVSLSTTLHLLVVGGEKLATAPVKSFFHSAPKTRLVNLYGPAEATVCATTFELSSNTFDYDDSASRPIPVGRCVPNTKVYLLDDKLRPVDTGFEGEICIGGAGLAVGYLGHDPAISDKFITINNLEGDGSSTRIYRTRDIGKFVYAGDELLLQYVGRNDNQVKIRGQRLEPGEIEAVLCASPHRIDQAAVIVTQGDKLIAYVVQKKMDNGVSELKRPTEQAVESIQLREAFYSQHFDTIDPTLAGADFTGWVSMYDGVPIPRAEMQNWLSDTLQSIPLRHSDSVLEIGCGTGMILFGLAPRCNECWGIDMLSSVVAYVQEMAKVQGLQNKVKVLQGAADKLPQLLPEGKQFDVIIFNSVVQYFPSLAYLEVVLKLCTARLRNGGRIFLGDIRNLDMDRHHDLARVLHNDPCPDLPTPDIRERVDRWQSRQLELKVNPSFFFELLGKTETCVSHVETLPKMMSVCNELSQFRYQVILHIGTAPSLITPERWDNFTTTLTLQELLSSGQEVVAIRGIPPSFIVREQAILQLMSSPKSPATASGLLDAAVAFCSCEAVMSPVDIKELSSTMGYQVDISIKPFGIDQTMAAVFYRSSAPVKVNFSAIATNKPLANSPGKEAADSFQAHDLVEKLYDCCRKKLPSFMVPHRIIIKKSLPLTGNGKVDRKELAEPHMWNDDYAVAALLGDHHPENETQARIQECISRVLNQESLQIPVHTDFIMLGLHSFRAPELLNSLRAQFSISDLPFRAIFQHPTVAALGAHLDAQLKTTRIPTEETTGRREVPYDEDALSDVLKIRGFTIEDVEDVYETTLAQKLLLMGRTPRSYMIHQVITARTDIDTFIRAIETVISRHTALRSTIFDKLERQVVFRYQDKLRDEMIRVHPAEAAQSLASIIKDDSRYALTVPGPLINFDVFLTEPPTLLILAHHAMMDAWSREVLLAELDDVISGQELPPVVPFRKYVDYVVSESNNPDDIAWHVERLRDAKIVGFPQSDQAEFTSSSCLGPDFLHVETLTGMGKVIQTHGIRSSTLCKVAFALIKRHDSKENVVLIPQAESCRSLPVQGVTEMCAPTYNIAVDRIDFFPDDTVLALLHRTQANQDKITDICVVNYGAVLASLDKDLSPFSNSSYNFSTMDVPSFKVLQPGPAGAENDIGIEWTTIVQGEQVKVKADCDAVFSDVLPDYVDMFFTALRWIISNLEAKNLDGLQL